MSYVECYKSGFPAINDMEHPTLKALLKKRLNRKQFVEYITNLALCTIVMHACGGSNYWASKFIVRRLW